MNKLTSFWHSLPDSVKRIIHTFWQSFVAALLVSVWTVNDIETAKIALFAAVAAGLSAVKAFVVNQNRG